MAIPEDQFASWSSQGSITQSKTTYAAIKNALEDSSSPYAERNFTPFLQGSYGNDTNIYADSDVDVVMRLDGAFQYDVSPLTEEARTQFDRAYANADYSYPQFKAEVAAWLKTKYGDAVKVGSKAITIAGNGARRDADVLPCIKFRRYSKFNNAAEENYIEGICFFKADGTKIINYPKQHSENCTAKHQRTGGRFKPTVRIFKNLRNRLIDTGMIEDGLAPSYYLEGMLYNVPHELYVAGHVDTFANAINWLVKADKAKLLCANEQYYLLWEGSPVTWRAASYDKFLSAAIDLWNKW